MLQGAASAQTVEKLTRCRRVYMGMASELIQLAAIQGIIAIIAAHWLLPFCAACRIGYVVAARAAALAAVEWPALHNSDAACVAAYF